MLFENIKNIQVKDTLSWKDKIFVTFDMDWCSDDVLSYTLDIIEKYDLKATFFVTHQTTLLERMKDNPNIELGIHPNFNFLLNGDFRQGKNIDEIIKFYKNIIEKVGWGGYNVVSVRSHSITQNSLILDSFDKNGLIYDCNTFIPFSSGIKCRPYRHFTDKLIKIPYFWEDDVHCLYNWEWNVDKFINYDGLKVFDFHPIHVYLNTENLARYEQSREFHKSKSQLLNHRYSGYGVNNLLIDLIEANI
ncbi:polysaccharide deacetylase WbmS family protein [Campylobacter hyointestinalis]|uniref:polysaccharide deacetylase WbmS family protein n=1 Tax=Campylobacter hyointestinalis TaxID=198 RepID=UPI000DCE7AC0|nr:polysaccharide deacetylase family protein [Campylobacter hyointestinalis]RAZ38564.1 hypothetical protein CHL9426_05585 [Campylobacter hyointestinalis subsp. lawsonii]RAZ51782.1 hypothetical protein CHL10075_05730 [Campylobacter hyointestinalis subsp. lawsonii]RAZ64041.1 hypothetical protein CHL9767_05060 [Campylobacter hyointestinalis subsp. lawsonii]